MGGGRVGWEGHADFMDSIQLPSSLSHPQIVLRMAPACPKFTAWRQKVLQSTPGPDREESLQPVTTPAFEEDKRLCR